MRPRRRLRVLTLIDRPSATGGAERIATSVAVRLDPERYEAYVCATRSAAGKITLRPELEQAGVRLLWLNRRTRADLLVWRRLLSLLQREKIDVLHAHKFGSNIWAATLGRLARVPVVIAHEHTWSFEGEWLRKTLDREYIAPSSDVLLAVSREDRRRMIEIEGIDPTDIRFLPNGIPEPQTTTGRDVRTELGLSADSPVIGTVCVMRAQKALDVLLRAVPLVTSRFPSLRVLIVGDGPERASLEALVSELELEGTVMMLGARSDVPDLVETFDVAVCSSDFEGSPLSVMEYMALGRPIVSTDVGGVPDLIENDVHGLLVERGDYVGLGDALSELLADPSRRDRMGKAARDRQRREFDIDAMVRRIERLYDDLYLASSRGRAEAAVASGRAAY